MIPIRRSPIQTVCLTASAVFLVLSAPSVWAHGIPTLVTTTAGGAQLAILGQVPLGQFAQDGAEVYADAPGIGVNLAPSGPPSGTVLGVETTGGLLYWNSTTEQPTDASITIEAPEFDSLGNPNSTVVDTYTVTYATSPLLGMTWSTYPGGSFWDAHGYYTLSTPSGPPAAGLYGVPLRLVALAPGPQLAASDSFLLPMLFDPLGVWSSTEIQAGIDALGALLNPPLLGDFDRNGVVGLEDYTLWTNTFGQSISPGEGADGSEDGLVNAADYTLWRDAAATNTATAVPEPVSLAMLLVVVSCFFPFFSWRCYR